MVARYVSGAYLDDANTRLLDADYASTRYVLDDRTPDGGLARETYLYPAAGRALEMRLAWRC